MYMYKNDGYVRRYSESFKLKVLAELTKGNYSIYKEKKLATTRRLILLKKQNMIH